MPFPVCLSTVTTKQKLSPFVGLWWMSEAKHSLECHFGCNDLTPSDSSAGKTPTSTEEMRARVLPFISVAKGQDLMHQFCFPICSASVLRRERNLWLCCCAWLDLPGQTSKQEVYSDRSHKWWVCSALRMKIENRLMMAVACLETETFMDECPQHCWESFAF